MNNVGASRRRRIVLSASFVVPCLLGASIGFYLQNPGSVAKRREVQLAPELQENVALATMWLVAKPFSEGKPAPQQELLEYELRVPGEVTRALSDKLIRAGLLSLAGSQGDRLVPGRALDLITIGDVLRVVRHDEDRIVDRLPKVIPAELVGVRKVEETRTFAQLLRGDEAKEKPGAVAEREPVSTSDS